MMSKLIHAQSLRSAALFTLFLNLILFGSGCGNPFSINGSHSSIEVGHLMTTPTPYKLPPAHGTEMVSLSAQYTPTIKKRFLIQSSIANMNGGIRAKTTQGKTIYSSVQGNLISDEK